jgi:Xaa-Pro aminopeptidase
MATDDPSEVARQIERRRDAVAAAWNLGDELILIGAGEPIPVPGRGDRTYPFQPHSEYLYLTDRSRPGGVLAYEPREGWTQFVRPVSQAELLWSGGIDERELDGRPLDELDAWLAERRGSKLAWLGQPPPTAGGDAGLADAARLELNHVRRQKDAVELARMRRAEQATRAGYAHVAPLIRAGVSERELQIELEAAFLRHGADGLGYDTIVGSGPNSAVLHFAPTGRRLQDGEVVLIDAGGEYRGYTSDVTRTYPVSGNWSPEQADLLAVVTAAGAAARACCRPGVEWRDVHLAAARAIAEGLAQFGLLRGDVDTLVESGAVRLFFPHGVGHMVGLGVRDAGEVLPGREGTLPGQPRLRVDLPLMRGHVFTIEPGIYFVPAILDDAEARTQQRAGVDWQLADRMRDFGGIRIEDNVLITEDGCEVLTADIPVA